MFEGTDFGPLPSDLGIQRQGLGLRYFECGGGAL